MSLDALKAEITALQDSYGRTAFVLYAMGLELGSDDYDTLLRDNVTDDGGDRKVDFFYLDSGAKRCVVAQDYFRINWEGQAAPANKASDLNTASAWLLDRELAEIPEDRIRKAAQELRDALDEGEIERIDFLYVHNLPESINVGEELATLEASLRARLEQHPRWSENAIEVAASEYGVHTIVSLQEQHDSGIRVNDELTISSQTTPQIVSGDQWSAVVLTALGSELAKLARDSGSQLYSSNVRDYLGSVPHEITSIIRSRLQHAIIRLISGFSTTALPLSLMISR
ncbi:MAG: hypothetical protein O3A10_13575 [Chloroflexi bacterium]|nr:hypothetical protein [Chloroflexota bacterium]MDA1147937.1 hypothetical protein [Chloroflexota bacterium]